MKLHKFPCEVQAGTVSKVGSNVRIDLTDFLEGKPINCASSALKVGLLFKAVSEHDGSTLVMIDHEAKQFETFRLAPDDAEIRLSLLCAIQPYAVLMGWTGSSRATRSGGLVNEGRAIIEGHPCDQLLAGDPTVEWTRYYAARDLDGLVIQIEWGPPRRGGGGEGLIAMFPPSGTVTLTNVTLEPREIKLEPPAGYKKGRVR